MADSEITIQPIKRIQLDDDMAVWNELNEWARAELLKQCAIPRELLSLPGNK